MEIINKDLKRRIIEISYKYKLSHLGSCLTAIDIIDEIYKIKKPAMITRYKGKSIISPAEKFILSSGHSGLALYCVIEKYEGIDAEKIFNHHGVHPDRCKDCHIYCSTGSLGQGLPIAVGMALTDKTKKVYCLISDGECSEGSIWEAWRITQEQKLENLQVYLNFNGWAAYKKLDATNFHNRLLFLNWDQVQLREIATDVEQFPFLRGQDAHYYVMRKEDYELAQNILR